MKKLFAVLVALGVVGFIACSAPATEEAEGTEESSAVVEEMQSDMQSGSETEMAEEATTEGAATEEGATEATATEEEQAQ